MRNGFYTYMIIVYTSCKLISPVIKNKVTLNVDQ